MACSTDPGSDGLCQHVLQPSGKLFFLIKNTVCFHAYTPRVTGRRGNSCRALRCWQWGACQSLAAPGRGTLVAGSRNSAAPAAASREAAVTAVRGADQPSELLQPWAGCSLLSRAEERSWSILNSEVGRAFIAASAPLRGHCSNGATVLFSSAWADWREAASDVPE